MERTREAMTINVFVFVKMGENATLLPTTNVMTGKKREREREERGEQVKIN